MGTRLGHFLPGKQILFVSALLMILAAVDMLRWNELQTPEGKQSVFHDAYGAADRAKVIVSGLIAGILTGFFGVGGGFVIVPALVVVPVMPAYLAVGTSLLIIAITSAAGLLAHLRYGSIDVTITLLFAVGGAALGGKVTEVRLRQIFAYGMVVRRSTVPLTCTRGLPRCQTKSGRSTRSMPCAGT
ncbi:MAG: hypothetical protein NVS4B2_29650 [Chloroflexota bacterium]